MSANICMYIHKYTYIYIYVYIHSYAIYVVCVSVCVQARKSALAAQYSLVTDHSAADVVQWLPSHGGGYTHRGAGLPEPAIVIRMRGSACYFPSEFSSVSCAVHIHYAYMHNNVGFTQDATYTYTPTRSLGKTRDMEWFILAVQAVAYTIPTVTLILASSWFIIAPDTAASWRATHALLRDPIASPAPDMAWYMPKASRLQQEA